MADYNVMGKKEYKNYASNTAILLKIKTEKYENCHHLYLQHLNTLQDLYIKVQKE